MFAQGVFLPLWAKRGIASMGPSLMLDVIVMGPPASGADADPQRPYGRSQMIAQIPGRQLLMGGLFIVGLGWALEAPGMLLEEGAQGMGWRLLTEEEGGIGPAQRIIQGPEIPDN